MKKRILLCIVGLALTANAFGGEIHEAAAEGNLARVKELLNDNPTLIGERDDNGKTPLHRAAYAGQIELMDWLVKAGADVNEQTASNSVALHGAAYYGQPEAVAFLIKNGADIDARNNYDYTPLLSASAGGYTDIAKVLLDAGADINAKNYEGDNALLCAVTSCNRELIDFLIAAGIDYNATDNYGRTILHKAIAGGRWARNEGRECDHLGIISSFISKGVDIDRASQGGYTVLSEAIFSEDMAAVRLLLEAGADANKVNDDGATALMISTAREKPDFVRLLLENGADIGIKESHFGLTALHLAAVSGNMEIVDVFLRHVNDVRVFDDRGHTPLFYAAKYGHRKVADKLVAKGASSKDLEENYPPASQLRKSLETGEAFLWYLGHCGWAIKTKNNLLVFDYFGAGANPSEPSLANGHLEPSEIADQNLTVFVTHEHQDHFDTSIFDWRDKAKSTTYVMGFKMAELPPEQIQGFAEQEYEYVGPREQKTINGMDINTIASNDAGVGFLVDVDGLTIYHAGDHAGWREGERDGFMQEIDYLAEQVNHVDFAFVNVTGCHVQDTIALAEGNFYTIEKLKPKILIPTHGQFREYVYRNFAEKVNAAGYDTQVICAEFRGDRFSYQDEKAF